MTTSLMHHSLKLTLQRARLNDLNDSQSVDDSNKVITIRNPDPNEQHRTQDPPPQRAAQKMMERQEDNDNSKEENHGYVEKLIQYNTS